MNITYAKWADAAQTMILATIDGNEVTVPNDPANIHRQAITEILPWEAPAPAIADIVVERERRLALGFDYDFGDVRGIHRIGTTAADLAGWTEVTQFAQAAINTGLGTTEIQVVTDTGPVSATANEWQLILMTAALVRQPIFTSSFALQAMDPIPANYADDSHWT